MKEMSFLVALHKLLQSSSSNVQDFNFRLAIFFCSLVYKLTDGRQSLEDIDHELFETL